MSAITLLVICAGASAATSKVCAVYSNVIDFASQQALDDAVKAEPPFLMEKHKRAMTTSRSAENLRRLEEAHFNTVFATIYPLWGKNWWEISAAHNLIRDALLQCRGKFRVHLGLSLFNANFCENPGRYPGASRAVQCDGTRPSWVCFFDDELWKTYVQNTIELAKLGIEIPGVLDGIFIDPEAYGPECYLCFCDSCVRNFNKWSGESMPTGLVKPDAWLLGRGRWKKYMSEWHDQEVRRHAEQMRQAIHAIDPELQLSSLLWDYPVAVGIGDAREGYFRNFAVGLGTKQKPAWVLPEHTYYSDAGDLERIIKVINSDIERMHAAGAVKVLPGIRLLRQPASSLVERGRVIQSSGVPGYWLYELADLQGKTPIDFEGDLVEPAEMYWKALGEMNRIIGSR